MQPPPPPPPLVAPDRVQAWRELLPARPTAPVPPAADRTYWEAPARQVRLRPAIRRAEALLKTPLPPWDTAAYLEFRERGLRPRGERMIKGRSAFLAPLVLAECAEAKGRFLPRLDAVLLALCEQPCWTIPAHDRALDSFSGKAPQVDLVAANLAADLGTTLFLLEDRLSPATVKALRGALETRIFTPLRTTLDTGRGPGHWWLKAASNWNAVCLAGVATAALSGLEDRTERARFAAMAERHAPTYLGSFQPGGYCTEGLGYWDYGFGHFVELREALVRASGGAVELYRLPALADVARFGSRILAAPPRPGLRPVPAFGDCRLDSQPDPHVQRMVALPFFGETRAPGPLRTTRLLEAVLDLAGPQPLQGPRPNPDPAVQDGPLRTWWPASGVLVARPRAGGRLALAAKGGGNGPHNHNDAGSYALFLDGDWLCGDVGGPREYTAESFSAQRFTKFRLNSSEGHPVPVVDGGFQRDTSRWAPPALEARFSEGADRVVYDLRGGYGRALQRLDRAFSLDRHEDAATVEDHFAAETPVTFETALTLRGTWRQLKADLLELQEGPRRVQVRVEASGPVDIQTERIAEANAEPFTRISLRLPAAPGGFIRCTFRPGS